MNEAYVKARQQILTSKVKETTALNLMFEKIDKIPPEITRLTKLETLNLHDTRIQDLSPLAGMTSLRQLSCGSNPIRSLTPLGQLVNLEILYANHCEIKEVAVLEKLPLLRTLDVRENRLADIGALAKCERLRYVDISNNLVTSLRPLRHVLERKVTLKTKGSFWTSFYGSGVMVSGCPLEDPPLTIADRGTRAVLNYWIVQDQRPRKSAPEKQQTPPVNTASASGASYEKLRAEVREALVRNDFARVFELLAKTEGDHSLLRGRWNGLERDITDGVISDADRRREENLLRRDLLEVIQR